MTERSVAQVHSVVYKLRGKQWDVQTKDWSQLHLYRDDRDGTYRIIGWSITTSAVVLNANVSPLCIYKRKSDDFHKFTDEDKVVWGFGFYMQPESIAEANRFLQAMEKALQPPTTGAISPSHVPIPGQYTSTPASPRGEQSFSPSNAFERQLSTPGPAVAAPMGSPPVARASTFRTMPSPHDHGSEGAGHRRHSLSQQGIALPPSSVPMGPPSGPPPPLPQRLPPSAPNGVFSPPASPGPPPPGAYDPASYAPSPSQQATLGAPPPHLLGDPPVFVNGAVPLGVLPILPPKQKRKEASAQSTVSDPQQVEHKQHVKYVNGRFVGLPQEWQEALSKQFGIPLALVDKVRVPEYAHGVPTILIQLREIMLQAGALNQVGIFRLAPDAEMCAQVKRQLDNGTFQGCTDANVMANLIKVWFRDLPRPLLADVPVESIQTCGESPTNAANIIDQMPEPAKSAYLWLLDLCVLVSNNSEVNKMPPQNLAICIAPNLFAPIAGDPMASLRFSQKVANFVTQSIHWRAGRT